MAAPWEKYQQQAQAPEQAQQPSTISDTTAKAPWERYAATQAEPQQDTADEVQTSQPTTQPEETPYAPEVKTKLDLEAYFSGQMSPDQQKQLEESVQRGEVQLPEGVTTIPYDTGVEQGIQLRRATTPMQEVVGAGEAALAVGTGATTGSAGWMAGVLKGLAENIRSGKYGTEEGAQLVEKTASDLMQSFTYEPKTEVGKERTMQVAEAVAPLMALAPIGGEIAAATQAAKLSPQVMKMKQAISKIPQLPGKQQLKTLIKEDPTNVDVAKYQIVNDRVRFDNQASNAIKQGFEDRVVASVKSASEADKKKMLQMLNLHKLGKKSATFAAKNRPADVIGKSIEDRVTFLNNAKKSAGNEIESAANSLKGKKVDYEPAINKFLTDLDDIGVKISIDNDGKVKINLRGSDIEGDATSKQLLKTVFERLVDTDVPDAYGVHRAKRFIDTQVSYGKTKANPLSKTTERIVKGLRANLNDTLGQYSGKYKTANTKYSDIISSLDDIQNAIGTKVDLDSPNAAKSLGLSSRKILSNYGSRVQMIDALDNIESAAKKYGMKIDDDIVKQVIFANEIDRMFGSPAATSFKGQIEQAVRKGTDVARRGLADTALDLASKGIEKARGINEENAIKSMEDILKRKETK